MDNKIYFHKINNNPIRGKVIYDEKDQSFFTKPLYNGEFTIMTGGVYIGLDVNIKNKIIVGVWGFCPKYCWINDELTCPNNIENGEVIINTNIELISGMGSYISEENPVYYCDKNNYICIGDKDIKNYDSNIRFMDDVIICLKNNEFKALWIKLIY